MVTTRAFALRDAGECYACQMLFEGGRFRCRPPFLFLHTKRPAPGAEAQPRCRSFYTVAPAGVEPTMGESKSPALPLGDGAPVRISIVEFLSFVKQKRFAVSVQSVLPHFFATLLPCLYSVLVIMRSACPFSALFSQKVLTPPS